MPLPLIPLIGAASSIISPILNATSQAASNRKTQNFSENMYALQRQHSIEDRDFQNAYNSPEAQMERLKKAGLNPNLVYGSGQAQAVSAQTRSAEQGNFKHQATTTDLSGIAQSLMMMYDLQKTQAQTDNLKAQIELIKEQTGDTRAHHELTDTNTKIGKFDLQFKQKAESADLAYRQGQPGALEESVAKVIAEKKVLLENNERQKLLTANTLAQGVQAILTSRLQRAKTATEVAELRQKIILLQQDERLKADEVRLRKLGLSMHDPAWMRMLGGLMDFLN